MSHRHTAAAARILAPLAAKDLWIGVQFDSATAGVQLNATPLLGSSHDYYLENSRFLYFGGDPVANFSLRVLASNATAADEASGPLVVSSLQVAPNPFNPRTGIRFELERSAHVQLELFDLAGRRVRTLLDEGRAAGSTLLSWNGRDDRGRRVASGVYVLRLLAGGTQQVRMLTLVE